MPRADVSLTITFRCTTVLARGDTVTIRLGGFKGAQASLFCLEPRPHPNNVDYRNVFHAYWSGESPPKGGPPAQSIFLQVRHTVQQNELVIIGVPDTVRISLPDKLGANSAKLKIEGVVKHSNGPGPNGKIPKAPVATCPEVKKKPQDDDLVELENSVRTIAEEVKLDEGEVKYAMEATQQEADHIWECARDLSELKLGMIFRMETAAWTEYKPYQPLTHMIAESLKAAQKPFNPLALHCELAKHLDVSVSAIILLEDVLYMLHGSQYSDLTRAQILVLRLWTMEPIDICRVLLIPQAPSIQREVLSAMRSFNKELVQKWAVFIAVLLTTSQVPSCKLMSILPENIPTLYRGVKDLPPEAIQAILALKRDVSTYVFPTFTNFVTEAKFMDEGFSAPDNAVVFEVRGVTEGIEIGDLSQYPENNEWMLPFFSSFRVLNVEQLQEKNHLIHVVLHYIGAPASHFAPVEDASTPEDRKLLHGQVGWWKNAQPTMGLHSHTVARLIYANLRLNDLKAVHPAHAVQRQYLEKFADVKRASAAKQNVEEFHVRWLMSSDTYTPGGDPVNVRELTWEPVHKKHIAVEALFLKRTRQTKQFEAEGVKVDFKDWTIDAGKGLRRLQRVVEKGFKQFTHPFVS